MEPSTGVQQLTMGHIPDWTACFSQIPYKANSSSACGVVNGVSRACLLSVMDCYLTWSYAGSQAAVPACPGDTALQQLPLTPSVFSPCSESCWRLSIERLLLMPDHMANRKGQTGCSHPYVTNLLGGPFCCTWVEITGGRGNILPGLIFSKYFFPQSLTTVSHSSGEQVLFPSVTTVGLGISINKCYSCPPSLVSGFLAPWQQLALQFPCRLGYKDPLSPQQWSVSRHLDLNFGSSL